MPLCATVVIVFLIVKPLIRIVSKEPFGSLKVLCETKGAVIYMKIRLCSRVNTNSRTSNIQPFAQS